MDIQQHILRFFTRSDKSLLGVCNKLSQKLKAPPAGVRIAFIALTLLLIPLGIIAYMGLYLTVVQHKNKIITFGLLGALLGIPLSYYFQSDLVKNYGSNNGVFGYLRNFIKMVEEYNEFVGNGWDIIFNTFLSMIVFALIGGASGYFFSKKESGKV